MLVSGDCEKFVHVGRRRAAGVCVRMCVCVCVCVWGGGVGSGVGVGGVAPEKHESVSHYTDALTRKQDCNDREPSPTNSAPLEFKHGPS